MTPRAARIVVLAAALLGAAVTARLGWWQLDRAAQKDALQAAIEGRSALAPLGGEALARDADTAVSQHWRAVRLAGEWVTAHTVFLDNRQVDGRPGFHVVTPLRLDGGADAVLVQRGWVPRDVRDRARLPEVPTPAGRVEVAGLIAPPPARLFEFDGAETGPIRQNLDLDAFARETGLSLRPLSIQQQDGADDTLVRRWPRPAVDVHKHYGYAFQWFALAVLIMGLYVWFQLVRPRRSA
jgi:surfeit locus 1 family protein